MKKLGLLTLALTFGAIALGTGFNANSAKADTSASEYAYGSWQKNEDVAAEIKGKDAWYINKENHSFTLNGVTWTFNYGRANTSKESDYKVEIIGYAKSLEGEISSHSILEYEESEDAEFYSLGKALLREGDAEFGNHTSAIYSSPITFNENVNVYLRNRYGGEFGSNTFLYFKAVDSNVTYIPEGSTEESVLYEQDTWYKFTLDDGESASMNASGVGTGTGIKGDYNECAFEISANGHWRNKNLKGHDIRLAVVYYTWENVRFPVDDAMVLTINDVVVNSTAATAAMLNQFSQREPNTESTDRNLCDLITTTDNYFGLTFRSTQKNLTADSAEVLANTALTGEYTYCSNCLELLNYLNGIAGIQVYYSNINVMNTYGSTVIIVAVTVFAILVGCSLLIVKRSRLNSK